MEENFNPMLPAKPWRGDAEHEIIEKLATIPRRAN
jgi:hypothetical protein